MQLTYIPPEQLRAVWPRVRAGLEVIQTKSPEGWWAEDVYHALLCSKAQLFLAGPTAWVISAIDQDEWTKAPVLHLWAAHSDGEDVVEAAMDQLRQIARASGCTSIRFGSGRKGWAKRYRIHSITYEVDA